jgi:hypothetical protein
MNVCESKSVHILCTLGAEAGAFFCANKSKTFTYQVMQFKNSGQQDPEKKALNKKKVLNL